MGKIIGWLLGIGAAVVGGLYLLGSRPEKPPVGDNDPWLTEYDLMLFTRLMALSRMYQEELLETEARFLGQEDEP